MSRVTAVMMMVVVVVVLVASVQVHAVYTFIGEGETKCFSEDLPNNTLLLAKYEIPAQELAGANTSGKPLGIHVTATGPTGVMFLDQVTDHRARIAFKSESSGEHTICFNTNSSSWFPNKKKIRFNFDIRLGEMAENYSEVAKREHLDSLALAIRRLEDRVKDVRDEQLHYREREEEMRDLVRDINSRVLWLSITQGVIVVSAAVYQLFYMAKLLKSKGA
eukprot:EC798108.1.p1 GENE.EC798108.1~~EC798108.1.p1  ORF type:complete len:220 (+),score=108.63 EC798108.1:50-709(+)